MSSPTNTSSSPTSSLNLVATRAIRRDRSAWSPRSLRSGTEWRLWRGEFGATPPFPTGPDSLFVAYYASAEIGCFLALNWRLPENVLDLFTEFRARTNGTDWLEGRGLLAALQYFNIDGIGAIEKQGCAN